MYMLGRSAILSSPLARHRLPRWLFTWAFRHGSTNDVVPAAESIGENQVRKRNQETQTAKQEGLRDEARAVLSKRTSKRSRFLDAALSNGPDFEPTGRLAG